MTRLCHYCGTLFLLALTACTTTPKAPIARQTDAYETISLLGQKLRAEPVGDREQLERNLEHAREELKQSPNDPDRHIWVGRRLGYLWRMNEAIHVYTRAIEMFPDDAPLYRHRGHRYISLRRFDDAIRDLEKAAEMIEGQPDAIEQDGAPNARNIPLTTLGFNVWYHLGLARYLKGDYEGALSAYRETMKHARRYEDNVVAATDWMYMTLRRLDRDDDARAILEPITANMNIIENTAYHRRLLMYKGEIRPEELLNLDDATDLDLATLGYGLGNWYRTNGDQEKARKIFQRVVTGPYWPAFGYIAAEVDLAQVREFE